MLTIDLDHFLLPEISYSSGHVLNVLLNDLKYLGLDGLPDKWLYEQMGKHVARH